MISLVDFVASVEEGQSKKEPLNLSFGEGVHYLPAAQKDIFDICAFSFIGIDEGSLKIDDLEVTNDVATLGRVIVYRIAVDGFASLSVVFVLPNGFKDAFAKRKEISGAIAALRSLPNENAEDKMAKFSSLYDVLEKEGASYVLMDGGAKLNHENKERIDKVIKEKKLTTLFLTYVPKEAKDDHASKVVIDEEGDFGLFFKKEGSTFLFQAIFAIIFSFSMFGAICLFTGSSAGLGVALLLVAIACFFMNFVVDDSLYIGAKRYLQTKKSYLKVQILSAFITIVASLLGLLIAYLCAKNNVVLPSGGSFGLAAAICVVGDVVLIIFAIFLSWPTNIWKKITQIFRKK